MSELAEILPRGVSLELRLLLQSKNKQGLLKALPRFFETLSSHEKTNSFHEKFQEGLNERNQLNKQQRLEAWAWLQDKVKLLKTSKWAENPIAICAIQKAEDAACFKFYNPLANPIEHIWNQLKLAACAVASFGPDPLFDSWAKFIVHLPELYTTESLSFFNDGASKNNEGKLVNELGSGIMFYEESPCKQFIRIYRGGIEEFFLPQSLEMALAGSGLQDEWEADVRSDVITLFTYLKLLAHYALYKKGELKPLKLPLLQSPSTLEEADEIYVMGCIVYWLSCFDDKDIDKHPTSLKELKKLILTFSTMLGSCISNQKNAKGFIEQEKNKRKKRDEARVRDCNNAKRWMKQNWNDKNISQPTMGARFQLALARGEIILEKCDYKLETIERWANQADPWPEEIRRKRPKTRNIKLITK